MDWDSVAYDKMLTYQVDINRAVELPLFKNEYVRRAVSVLDIGCGNGYFTAMLADQYPDKRFVAVDGDAGLISFAKKNNPRKNITYVNTMHCEFQPDTLFDVVIARLLVHIIPDRSDFFRWVSEKLQPEGAFIVVDADDDNFSIYPEPPTLRALDRQTNDKINHIGKRDTKSIVAGELRSCGFHENRFFTFSPNSLTVDKSLFFKYLIYVMKIERGDDLPAEAYKELFEWYDNEDSFVQYGLYFGLYTKEDAL